MTGQRTFETGGRLTRGARSRDRSGRPFTADVLIGLLRDRGSEPAAVAREFDLWGRVIDSLPLMQSEYLFAHNWWASARELWKQGERHTAAYQLRQVGRRLDLLPTAVSVLSPSAGAIDFGV